jgi:hypothetical protein
VDFYHHLVGETNAGPQWASLLLTAGQRPDGPLHMGYFAGALAASGDHKVVYESSHDEAGNDPSTERTILTPSTGHRWWARHGPTPKPGAGSPAR